MNVSYAPALVVPCCQLMTLCLCNELGKGRPRLETGATDDGLSGFSRNRHNPVMVYNDLMIRNITVGLNIFYFVTNRASPIQRR